MEMIMEQMVGWFSGVSDKQLRTAVLLMILIIAVLAISAIWFLYGKLKVLQEADAVGKWYRDLEHSFRNARRDHYGKLQLWLKSVGVDFCIKGFGDPFFFLSVNLLILLGILICVGLLYDIKHASLFSAATVVTELILLVSADKKNNRKMLEDVSFLYDATAIQMSSHIYIADAIGNCLPYIGNQRFKKALAELYNSLILGGDVRSAARDFSEKFSNSYLDTFSNLIVQITTETGGNGKLIDDMSQQLAALREVTFMEQKKSTETRLELCIIGIFIVFTLLIFYLCVASMTGTTAQLF